MKSINQVLVSAVAASVVFISAVGANAAMSGSSGNMSGSRPTDCIYAKNKRILANTNPIGKSSVERPSRPSLGTETKLVLNNTNGQKN